MEFNIPTTKTEMYAVLSDLFVHYRIKRVYYDGIVLEELTLPRIEKQMPTDVELMARAEFNVHSAHVKAKLSYTDGIKKEITDLEAKLLALENTKETTEYEIETKYGKAISSLNAETVNSQTEGSGIYFAKVCEIEKECAEKIAKANDSYEKEKQSIMERITRLNQDLSQAESVYGQINESEVQAEFLKLKEQAEDRMRDIFKYNNSLEEKELKYRNYVKQAQANNELKFMSIKSEDLSKDQLIDLGYYSDVIDCVCSYYNSLDAKTAYNNIINESKLMLYLDEYYQDVVFIYK